MRRYFLLAALAACIWGSTGPIVRTLEMGGNGYLFGSLKVSLGLIILAIPLLWQKRSFWQQVRQDWQRHWPTIIGSSACFSLCGLCIFQAFALTTNPALASAIFYTSPVLSSVGAQLLRGRLQGHLILAALICFSGVALVLVAISDSPNATSHIQIGGLAFAIGAALLTSTWALLSASLGQMPITSYRLCLYQAAIGVVIINSFTIISGHWDWDKVMTIATTPHQAGWLLFSATIGGYFVTVLFLWCLRQGGAALISPATFADVITTPFWAWLIIGTAIVPWSLVGIAITVAGGYLAMRKDTTPT